MRKPDSGLLALLVVGGIYIYQNRFKIMQFLESKDIRVPSDTSDLKSTLRSGVSKVTGRAQSAADELRSEVKKAG